MFSSCTFFLTDGVADVNAPSLGEIQSIVESGGGTWIHGTEAFIEFCRIRHTNLPQSSSSTTATASLSSSSSSSSSTAKSAKKKSARSLECESQSLESDFNNNKNIVILSSEAAYVSLGVHVRTAITSALQSQWVMGDGIYSLEILFLAVLRQQLTFQNCNLLQSFQNLDPNSQSNNSIIEDKKKGNSKTKKAK